MMFKRLTAVIATAIFLFVLSLIAGAGEWKALYKKVVFADPEAGKIRTALFVYESNGATRQLTSEKETLGIGSGSWSPDGTEIVYPGVGGLHVMNADGSDKRAIGVIGGFNARMTKTHFVYEADEGNRSKIWALSRNSDAIPIAIAMGGEPDVSFDGKLVAFEKAEIWIVGIDGMGERLVTEGRYAKFLPDGRIVVLRDREHPEIWIVDPETGEEQFLTIGRSHSISSDGWVLFEATQGGWYVIRPNGEGKRLLVPDQRNEENYSHIFGDLSPEAPSEEPRQVKPKGKLATMWGVLKK